VVVIDELDECEGGSDVGVILERLPAAWTVEKTPLRILVTSRLQTPIWLGFEDNAGSKYENLTLQEIPLSMTEHDLLAFFQHEFTSMRHESK
jgi:hypothetical protein